MTPRDPRMLPGISAQTALTIAAGALIGFIAVLLLALFASLIVNAATHWTNTIGLTFLLVLGGAFVAAAVLVAVFAPVGRQRERAELAAGYTTLLKEFNQVDGISARTGLVVRPATVRPTGTTVSDSFTTGREIGPIAAGSTPFQIVARSIATVVTMTGSIILLLGGALWLVVAIATNPQASGPSVGAFFVAFTGFCGIVCVAVVAFTYLPSQFYCRRLDDHFPDGHALGGVPDNSDIVGELLGPDATSIPEARYRGAGEMVFRRDSLVLVSRHRNELLPYLVIPRTRVTGAKLTSRSLNFTNGTAPAVTLSVTKDNGSDFHFVAAIAPRASKTRVRLDGDCQWVMDWVKGTN